MHSPEFLSTLSSLGAIHQDSATAVDTFGDAAAETSALLNNAAVIPLPELIQIVVTGKDRGKFLHNFCTNQVNELPSGHTCEAFFGNVQARVLAHGYVLAAADKHELWMLPGDEQSILNHLNKYVITDDVVINSCSSNSFLMIAGPGTADILAKCDYVSPAPGEWKSTDPGSVLLTRWSDLPTAFVACPSDLIASTWEKFTQAGAQPAGMQTFHRHRIQEGFPLVGIDLTEQNLIPEANRNASAISYTKGCYLGQEPIARIDAMGHVNRKLLTLSLEENQQNTPDNLPQITSLSEVDGYPPIGLALVPSKLLHQPFHVQAADGRQFTVTHSE